MQGSLLDRRGFFRLSGSAVLAVAFAPVSVAGGSAARRNIRKSLMYYMCEQGSTVREKFEIIRRAGFEGVEMDSPSTIPIDEIRSARDATGLAISGIVDSVHWRKTLGDADDGVRREGVAALETAIRDCHTLGGRSVLLVPGIVNANWSYEDVYTRSQTEIRKVLPLAAELKVKIAIENVWNDFLLSPLEAARYVDEFDSPWVGWHLDCGNILTYGYPEQWVRVLGKRLVTLHIKDFSRKKRDEEGYRKGFDVKLGDGDANWPVIMKALDDVGFEGWGSAEVAAGDEVHLEDVVGRMNQIFQS